MKYALLIGEAATALEREFRRASIPTDFTSGLEEAVSVAASAAKPGEVILLSPACASYDQFANFEERGETFKRLVRELER